MIPKISRKTGQRTGNDGRNLDGLQERKYRFQKYENIGSFSKYRFSVCFTENKHTRTIYPGR